MSKRFALSEEEMSDNDSISGKPSKMKRKPESMSRDEPGQQNILLKILNRERYGYFNNNNVKSNDKIPYKIIPSSLAFCLKDIVPVCYLESHVFMGLTACGQFLISYKRFFVNEETIGYDFSSVYKYELFFWIYSPGKLLSKYYNVSLFDDHNVNYIKFVTMSQWTCDSDSRTLIIHGASEIDDTCFVSFVRIPKLGCLDCKQLRDIEMDSDIRQPLCIQCCLTIHTKYHYNESTQLFNPSINLNCPKYIIMSENSFIHTINVRLDMKKPKPVGTTVINWKYLNRNQTSEKDCINKLNDNDNFINNISNDNDVPIANAVCDTTTKKKQTIVDEILADFSEYDIEYGHHVPSTSTIPTTQPTHVYFQNLDSNSEFASETDNIEELIITCTSRDPRDDHKLKTGKVNTQSELPVKKFIKSSPEKSSESNSLTEVAAKTYEFSEDNEKYEKISIFRKRRLADKKYEFSEDNSENIIPFNRMRNRTRNEWPAYKFHGTHTPLSPAVATSHYNYNLYELQSPHSHRASPNHGFRSPCGSPVSNRYLRSPPGFRSPSYRSHMLSPPKTFLRHGLGNAGPSSSTIAAGCDEGHKYFSDIINRIREIRANANFTVESNHPDPLPDADLKPSDPTITPGMKTDKPFCSKKIIKYFVEEDDATSVITNEEDDCISPGYHTSLPMEVHGGCYGNMQIISKSNLSKLSCPVVVITQNSFDVEAFTIFVANDLCSKNNKKYGILYDSVYEISHVCPISQNITCVLMLQFTASDFERVKHCQNCSNTSDCLIHRKLYQSTVLFSWNISSGEYDVLDYGKLRLSSVRNGRSMPNSGSMQVPLVRKLNKFTKKLFGADLSTVNLLSDNKCFDHLRILDANEYKTKDSLVDLRNCIEFYRRHPYDTPDSVCSFTMLSGSEDSNISFSSDDEFDEPENVEDSTANRSTDTSAISNLAKTLLSK